MSGRGLELEARSDWETIDITGDFTTGDFNVSTSGTTSSIMLKDDAPCFVAGTRILTPLGETPVEALNVGDLVISKTGEDLPIVWIGYRTLDLRRHPRTTEVQPICIAASALAEDVPRCDLWVSPAHAMLIDGRLIPAKLLLNGRNIRQGSLTRVTYYHLELAQHSIIFAENAPTESYLDTGNRNAFENAGGVVVLHPDFSETIRQTNSCALLLLDGAQLDEIRRRHLQRSSRTDGRSSTPSLSRSTNSIFGTKRGLIKTEIRKPDR